jgi:putative hydrolase of the HAD superfamily
MKSVKNIIFDLGGVLLNIDFDRAAEAFRQAGLNDFEQLYSRAVQSDLFDRLERGKITPEAFRKELCQLAGIKLSDAVIDRCWNALLLDFPPARLQLLQELRENYRLFLLSNTNIIHAEAYNDDLRKHHNINGLEALFDKLYYSHDIGLRKPAKESFLHVLNDQKIQAGETLFIDDSLPNIEAARALGMQTLHIDLEAGDDVCNFFENGKWKIK